MALPLSEDRLQSALERFINATPRMNDWDVNRIHKLASLGSARRVPCDPHGQSTSPAHHSDVKSGSPSSTTARNNDLVVPGKKILSSKDSSDLRKRKAEKDAPSFRQHIIARPMEGHINSDISNNSEAAAYLKSREFVSSTKEVISSQDKENINPYCGNRRCESKKQALDGSNAKRGLQVSKKLQNVPGGRKVGSLLMKQSSNCRMEARRVLHPHSEDGSIEKVKAVSEVPNTVDCINRSNGVLGTDRKGKTEQSPVQVAKQAISKPSLFGACFEESLDAKIVVEGNQLATSVRKLSSSMNCLAIADRPYGIPTSLAPEKGHKQRENALQSENVQGAFISAPKQCDLDVQAGASAACLSQPATSAPAWSYTIRTTSAPLSTCSTEDSVPPLNPQVLRPSKVRSPVVANDIQKASQSSSAPAFSEIQPRGTKSPEKQSPAKPPMVEREMMNAAGTNPSRDDNPLSDAGAGKLIQHLSLPEKRPTNTGEPNLQPKKHGENEYFVWVNGRRYQKLKKAGRGGSSEVYKVIDRDGNIYALKRIKLKGRDYTTACGFYQEIELLTRLQGKSYIIRLIDHEVTDKNLFSNVIDGSHTIRHDAYIYMVLEYGEVDLATMLQEKLKERQQGGKDVDETWLRFYWQQILEAVNTVHEERIIHADLKPANFLLVKGVLKLIDFGIAKSILGDTTNIERDAQVGTLNYMSPEAFLMNEKDEHGNVIKCGRPSDIWALGCILYQMVYGKTPFAHIMALHAKIQEVANPNHKINFPPVSNPYLLDIMKKCLAYKREDRLRIPELLQHPFLQPQMVAQLQPGNSQGKDGARTSCARQVERKILLKIRTEKEQGRDVRALMSLLEEVRLLELCGGPRWPTTGYEGQHDDA